MKLWFRSLTVVAAVLGVATTTAAAQGAFPQRDVELVVPYSAGGSVDGMARAFAKAFGAALGRDAIVQNRDGGGGVIGVNAVRNAPADGHTILFSPATPLTQVPFLTGNVPYTLDDFHPVCQLFENPFVIAVREESPLRSLEHLLEQAKARPGSLSFGHAGIGSVPHLATASLAKASGVTFNEIAFRGDAQVIPQVLGGHVDFGSLGVSTVAGKPLRVLASLGNQRIDAFPDAPAVTEFGVKHAIIARNGLYVSSKVPAEVRARLEAACLEASRNPEFLEAAKRQFQQVTYMDADAYRKQLQSDYQANEELIRSLGLAAK